MNPRYLWSENLMMEGNNDVIWGFIEDIWYWNHNKISPSENSQKIKSKNRASCSKFEITNSSFRSIGQEMKNSESCNDNKTVRIYNAQESFWNNTFEERSRKVSPETIQQYNQEDQEIWMSVANEDANGEIIPNTRDCVTNMNFSVAKLKRNSYSSAKKRKDISRNSEMKK